MAHDAGGIARHHRVGRHVTGHHGARGHHRPVADGDAGQDQAARSEPDVAADGDVPARGIGSRPAPARRARARTRPRTGRSRPSRGGGRRRAGSRPGRRSSNTGRSSASGPLRRSAPSGVRRNRRRCETVRPHQSREVKTGLVVRVAPVPQAVQQGRQQAQPERDRAGAAARERRAFQGVRAMGDNMSDDLKSGALVYHRLPAPGKARDPGDEAAGQPARPGARLFARRRRGLRGHRRRPARGRRPSPSARTSSPSSPTAPPCSASAISGRSPRSP